MDKNKISWYTFLKFLMCPTCIPTQFLQICNTHGSASIDPIEDIEDLILYTKKRIWSAKDPYTSREIMWVDVGLCHKKLSELQNLFHVKVVPIFLYCGLSRKNKNE